MRSALWTGAVWCLCLALGSAGAASATPPPWLLQGAAGGTWRQDSSGTWRGGGANWGRTWRQDASGTWRGGGPDFRDTWRQDSTKAWRGGGRQWGGTWRQDSTGTWRGQPPRDDTTAPTSRAARQPASRR
jgi:hypothetical protein